MVKVITVRVASITVVDALAVEFERRLAGVQSHVQRAACGECLHEGSLVANRDILVAGEICRFGCLVGSAWGVGMVITYLLQADCTHQLRDPVSLTQKATHLQ